MLSDKVPMLYLLAFIPQTFHDKHPFSEPNIIFIPSLRLTVERSPNRIQIGIKTLAKS